MSDDTLGTSIYLVYISIGFQTSRLVISHLYGTNGCQEHGQEHAKGQQQQQQKQQQQQQLFLALEAV